MEGFKGKNSNTYSKIAEHPAIKLIDVADMVNQLSKQQRDKLIAEYNMPALTKIFKDSGMMQTIEVFLQSGMNISRTAKILYMHRNTLIYKLNSIRKLTGLDLRDFNMAVTFKVLYTLYVFNK